VTTGLNVDGKGAGAECALLENPGENFVINFEKLLSYQFSEILFLS